MAKRGGSEQHYDPDLPPDRAIEMLKVQIAEIDVLKELPRDDPQIDAWREMNQKIIMRAFGTRLGHHRELFRLFDVDEPYNPFEGPTQPQIQRATQRGLEASRVHLLRFIKELEGIRGPLRESRAATRPERSDTVFIVHGHDEQGKSELARIIEKLGLRAVILHEQSNRGRTLIEKLEAHAATGYCFVLLTPDDEGKTRNSKEPLTPRARQNVVLELGMFIGLLGRDKVGCLYSGEVEIPSDLGGLALIRFGRSVTEKQLDIVRELRAAGFDVSADKLSSA